MKDSPYNEKENSLWLFLWASLAWLVLGWVFCAFLGTSRADALASGFWMAIFWGLCVLDLWVLARFMSVAMAWMNAEPEKRTAYSIQAFCWGLFKLVCLGLFIGVLLKGYEIPTYGLLLGMGTLGVVPLFGGFLWSQRILRNA
jgi:hypothetical protein